MYLSIPAVIYKVVIPMVPQCSVSEVDGEGESRGPDLEDKFCVRISIRDSVTRQSLRLGINMGKVD